MRLRPSRQSKPSTPWRFNTTRSLADLIAIILIIVTIAVPQYNKQMMSGHETAAIKAIETIHAVEIQYNSQFGRSDRDHLNHCHDRSAAIQQADDVRS